MVVNIFIGLICIGTGALFSFLGYLLSRILLPILAFFSGLIVISLFAEGLINTILGVAVGLGLAWLSYFFLPVRMIMTGLALGLLLPGVLMGALSFSPEVIAFVAAIAAIIFGSIALLPFIRKYIIIAATALAGASLITVGILYVIPNLIPPGSVSVGQVLLAFSDFPLIVFIIWIPVAALGLIYQYRTFRDTESMEEDEA